MIKIPIALVVLKILEYRGDTLEVIRKTASAETLANCLRLWSFEAKNLPQNHWNLGPRRKQVEELPGLVGVKAHNL
jgi:hypothetical protein